MKAANWVKVLALLDSDPGREWTAQQVASELGIPGGTAGSSLHNNWKNHRVARRKVGPQFLWWSLALPHPAGPPTPVPGPDCLTQVAALWSTLTPDNGEWTPQRVRIALIVADHVTGRDPDPRLALEPGLWFTEYTTGGDQPPATKERDHE